MSAILDALNRWSTPGADTAAMEAQIRAYAAPYGLTDAQIASNIGTFGQQHQNQFGTKFTQYSSVPAIAQMSVANALTGVGRTQDAASFQANPQLALDWKSGEGAGQSQFDRDQAANNSRLRQEGGAMQFAGASTIGDRTGAGYNTDLMQASRDLGLTYQQAEDALRGWSPTNGAWNGVEGTRQALGQAMGGRYKELSDSLFNPQLAAQQGALHNSVMTDAQARAGGGWSDLGALMKVGGFLGGGYLAGMGGLSGLFDGAEAGLGFGGYGGAGGTIADFTAGGGLGATDASLGAAGNINAGNGITSSFGYGTPMQTAVSAAGDAGGNMSWYDDLMNAIGGDGTPNVTDAYGGNDVINSLGDGGIDVTNSATWTGNQGGQTWQGGTDIPTTATGMDFSWINQLPPGMQQAVKAALGIGGGAGGTSGRSGNFLTDLLGGAGNSSAVGGILSGLLGYNAANNQTNAYKQLADQYAGYGAPYRQKLSDLMGNPDSFLSSSEVQQPIQQGTNALMRSLSTSGNPFGSGNALQQGQNYASNSFYDKLQGKENQLAAFGGLANFNGAVSGAANNAIASQGNASNAIGSGLNDIFSPPKTLAENLSMYKQMMGG